MGGGRVKPTLSLKRYRRKDDEYGMGGARWNAFRWTLTGRKRGQKNRTSCSGHSLVGGRITYFPFFEEQGVRIVLGNWYKDVAGGANTQEEDIP